MENAKKAVVELHRDYMETLRVVESGEATGEAAKKLVGVSQTLAIAFFNVGVQQEHFQNYDVSLINYGKACEVAEDNLGRTHKLTVEFKRRFQQFTQVCMRVAASPYHVRRFRNYNRRRSDCGLTAAAS